MKKIVIAAAVLMLSGAAALLAGHRGRTAAVNPNSAPPSVAHAGGGYKGQTYLNCLECFEENYQKGHRLFEFDLMMTSDDFVVAIHDG
jgi:glycerophosphoryl diester phosphodiesterase